MVPRFATLTDSGRRRIRLSILCMVALVGMACLGLPAAAQGKAGPKGAETPKRVIKERELMATDSQEFRYGFRYNPMEFVESDPSLQGAMVHALVFGQAAQGDEEILQRRIKEIFATQKPDGQIGDAEDPITGTASRLRSREGEVRRGIN